jgi:hypothetical protein
MRVQVCVCLHPLAAQRTNMRALRWLLRTRPGDGNYDAPEHVYLLKSNVHVVVPVMLLV